MIRPIPMLLAAMLCFTAATANATPKTADADKRAWPDGSQLVISISMQYEAGGQPEGAESPFSGQPIKEKLPDLIAHSWFNYGSKEGVHRMLDLWDKYKIKVTSHVVGLAAQRNPELVKEIHDRGHEVASHGMSWTPQYNMPYEKELAFVKAGNAEVEKITGVAPKGYNAFWMRRGPNTLKVLQDAGMTYHIDDLSRDEPFITMVKGKPFAVVPYTVRNNDIVLIEGRHFSAQQFLDQLKLEFDRLYAEGKTQRRMMSVSLHDRIGGSPAVVEALDQFLAYASSKNGVTFKRKDEIANVVLTEEKPLIDHSEDQYNK
jgi:peptidoglycan/xylan/chitin deacetylase (PgdA/CDA1 family)